MALKTPKLDTSAKQSAYSSFLDEEEKKNVPEEDDSYLAGYEPGSIGYQNAKANRPTGLSTNVSEAIPGLLGPSKYVQDALSLSPEKRTSAQREALKVRRRNEEITAKSGRRIQNGITQELINEEVAPDVARRETKAAIAYKQSKEKVLSDAGYGADYLDKRPAGAAKTASGDSGSTPADGSVVPAAATPDTGSPTPTASKATSGGTIKKGGQTVTVPGQPAGGATPGPAPRGFAMRTMADGTVKTASGVVGNNSNIQSFGTQAEALAYYQPQVAPAIPVPNGPAGTPPTVMTAHNGQPAAYAQPAAAPAQAAPAPVAPSGAAAQTPAAARTTSPTQQLATSIAKGPAPAAPAAPATTFQDGTPLATALPNNGGYDLTPGLEELRRRDASRGLTAKPNLAELATANRSFGIPKRRTGYQQQAEDLNPMALTR